MASHRQTRTQNAEYLLGDVRVHHIVQGQLAVLDARGCSHCWKVFHTTYSFCLVLRIAPTIIQWKYNRRMYEVDSRRPVMVMQPGEVHANLLVTPPADFIVVQVGDELMKQIARDLGWRAPELHIKNPDCSHPALVKALATFGRRMCTSLYDPRAAAASCSCVASLDVHLENLVGIVAAFIQHGAESGREVPVGCNGAALVSHAVQFLLDSYTQPYCLDRLLKEVAPRGNYSRFYLVRAFKEALGVSPREFQNIVLAGRTRDALSSSSHRPFDCIVQQVGWPGNGSDGANRARAAYRHFTRTWCVSPGEYRKNVGLASSVQHVLARLKAFT